MVRRLSLIEHTAQVCDACLSKKRQRSPFPQQASYRAMEPLELAHGDMCSTISSTTPGSKRYLLLLMDDHKDTCGFFLLCSKNPGRSCAHSSPVAEGEFNSDNFAAYFVDLGVQGHLIAPYTP